MLFKFETIELLFECDEEEIEVELKLLPFWMIV
jgi:hypothetical protein